MIITIRHYGGLNSWQAVAYQNDKDVYPIWSGGIFTEKQDAITEAKEFEEGMQFENGEHWEW